MANSRINFTTTLDKEILEGFKTHCKECGFPMNVLLEQFMKQFTNNELEISIKRNKD